MGGSGSVRSGLVGVLALACTTAAPAAAIELLAASGPAGSTGDVELLAHPGSASNFYGGAETISYSDYVGVPPIEKADLIDDAAHLFLVDTTDGRALFVVYESPETGGGNRSAGGRLAVGPPDLVIDDVLVRDSNQDDYSIDLGELVTEHEMPIGGNSDGFAVALGSRFASDGDSLAFTLTSPVGGGNPLTTVYVYTGLEAGEPSWFELASGDLSAGVVLGLQHMPEPAGPTALAAGAAAVFALRRKRQAAGLSRPRRRAPDSRSGG